MCFFCYRANVQKQPSIGALQKRRSPKIYWRSPMQKYSFNRVA